MATRTSKLILSLVDKVTAPARGVAASVANMQSKLEANNKRLSAMRGRMVEAAAVGYGLARAIQAPIKAAVEFESSMADVRKVVNFESPKAFKQMSADIVEMSTRIPIAATGIADIVAAAGQAGMAGSELLSFTEMAAKVGVAFDMTAGSTGDALAKIKTALQLTVAQTGALADAINFLSNTSAAAAPDILDFMSRVGSTGKQYGFTAQQTAAIGSAMIATGAQSEVAATSFRSVGRALTKGASATKSQRRAFKQLGLSATDVSKRMQKDAVGTLRDVIVHIQKLPKAIRASAISDLFGEEARAIAPLIDQLGIYDDAVKSVAQSANYLGSSQKEFETRSETTANAMQLFSNKVTAAGIAIGSALLPALNGVMDALGPIALSIARFAENNPRLTSTIVALTAGLVGLRVAAIAAQWSFFWMRGAYLQAAIAGLKGVGGALNSAKLAFLPFGAAARGARSAMIGFAATAAIAGKGEAFKQLGLSMIGLLNPLRMVTGAMRLLKLAVIGTGIGAILVGIAAAGTAIYNNWAGIKEMFAGIGEGISSAFPGAGAMIDTVSSAISKLAALFGNITGPIDASSAAWRAFGVSIGESIGGAINTVLGFPAQVIAALQPMLDFFANLTIPAPSFGLVIDAFNGLLSVIQTVVGGIETAVGKAVGAISRLGAAQANVGASNANALKPIMPGDSNAGSLNSAISGARAAGGPIAGGRTYLVGEEGPELITPNRGGFVNTASDTAGMMSGGGSRAGVGGPRINAPITISSPFTINVARADDALDPSSAHFQQLVRDMREAMHRITQYEVDGMNADFG